MPAGRVALVWLVVLSAVSVAGCGGTTGSATPSTASRAASPLAADDAGPAPAPDAQPLADDALRRPIARWRSWAIRASGAVRRGAVELRAAVRSGDDADARRAWLRTDDAYLRLGAAYGSLGSLDDDLDGIAGRLSGGTDDPRFGGLQRIQRDLWAGRPDRGTRRAADGLVRDAARLPAALQRTDLDALTYATRAHEILEDAQEQQLGGSRVRWNHEGVRGTLAAVGATDEVLGTLRPLMDARTDATRIDAAVGRLRRDLVATRSHGVLPPTTRLPARTRERLDADLGLALEALATIPDALETAATRASGDRPTIAEQARAAGRPATGADR